MGDYDLSGLNTRSFEQLIQAITVKVFGPNIIIFGDGPDGGREATFEGTVPYPSKEQAWNGYGVIQAKFLQRPLGAPMDGAWALQQLHDELAKFNVPTNVTRPKKAKVKSKARANKYTRRIPDYYIFITNAVLTPVGGQGTKDKAYAILEDFKKDTGLKDFDIWDYDKICAYLDGYEDIRHCYEGFITTGDVLARVMEWLRPSQPHFKQVIYRFLQEELLTDQYANLEQAGRATEDKVPIAKVFVDLPTFAEQLIDPPTEEASTTAHLPTGFVAEVLNEARNRLDPASLKESTALLDDAGNAPDHRLGRFVLVGGPGQGKTTIGQFIAQLFRTAILKDRADWIPVREIQDILDLVSAQCQTENIGLPRARRFPLRIVLSDFAKEVASTSGITSVLSYITARIKKQTDVNATASDLRLWLKNYPWLIIFDGLDEVPASSNRKEVLAAIQRFRIEINECNADVLIIATTRPQGYSGDFAPNVYEHKWLAPLSTTRAMHYARRLVEVRYAANKDRKERVLTRLERAAHTEATARLMRSPLQVTIMTTLVGTRGQPPQERWGLFNDYYKVIYQREMEREIPASDILRAYRSDIDRIHNRVGLILQAKSERSGETDARLSERDFATIVADRLNEEGHEDAERDELQRQIMEAATDRLVFIVGLQENQIGFEIRSLQEFMAAEALMDGREQIVRQRLREIAPIPNWRNVFLFAAGKCFADRQDLRDTVYTVCAEINDNDVDAASYATLEGSHLALDLIEEGVTRTQPRFAKLFARLALRILNLPPVEAHVRLAKLYEAGLETIYREELSQRLNLVDFYQQLGTWACLVKLIDLDIEWARQLGDQHWPSADEPKLELLRIASKIKNSWKVSKLIEVSPRLSPHDLVPRRNREDEHIFKNVKDDSLPAWFRAIKVLTGRRFSLSRELTAPVNILSGARGNLKLTIHTTTDLIDRSVLGLLQLPEEAQELWAATVAVVRFINDPSKEALAQELKGLAATGSYKSLKQSIIGIPWPLAACLAVANNQRDLYRLAAHAEDGGLGGVIDWEAAEKRWSQQGITAADFEYIKNDRLPFDKHIAEYGFPFTATSSWSTSPWERSDYPAALVSLHERLRTSRVGDLLAGWISFVLAVGLRQTSKSPTKTRFDLSREQLINLIDDTLHTKRYLDITVLNAYKWKAKIPEDWLEFLDKLGQHKNLSAHHYVNQNLVDGLSKTFTIDPSRTGILRLLSLLIARGGNPSVPIELLSPEQYEDSLSRASIILIRIAQKPLSSSESELLARFIAELVDDEKWVIDAILLMLERNQVPSNTALDKFLLIIRSLLPATMWRTGAKITKTLGSSLKRRTSGLEKAELWANLRLRSELGNLVKSDRGVNDGEAL